MKEKISKRIGKDIYVADPRNKYVFMSDMHLGILDNADETVQTMHIIVYALEKYLIEGYTLVLLGDTFELAENHSINKIKNAHADIMELLADFHEEGRLVIVRGNHDAYLNEKHLYTRTSQINGQTVDFLPEIHIYDAFKCGNVLAVHGHQNRWMFCSWFNRVLIALGKIWCWWQKSCSDFHSQESTGWESASKFDNEWNDYASNKGLHIIAGHSHKVNYDKPHYTNTGTCGVMKKCITCTELQDNNIASFEFAEHVDINGFLVILKTNRRQQIL